MKIAKRPAGLPRVPSQPRPGGLPKGWKVADGNRDPIGIVRTPGTGINDIWGGAGNLFKRWGLLGTGGSPGKLKPQSPDNPRAQGLASGLRRGLGNDPASTGVRPGGIGEAARREALGEKGALWERLRDQIESWVQQRGGGPGQGPGGVVGGPGGKHLVNPDIIRTPNKDVDPPPPTGGSNTLGGRSNWLIW